MLIRSAWSSECKIFAKVRPDKNARVFKIKSQSDLDQLKAERAQYIAENPAAAHPATFQGTLTSDASSSSQSQVPPSNESLSSAMSGDASGISGKSDWPPLSEPQDND